jgi:hypothetical protein
MELAPNGKPKVTAELVGQDGNAMSILGRVTGAMRREGWTAEERKVYTDEATSGDYDHLLQVTLQYCDDE